MLYQIVESIELRLAEKQNQIYNRKTLKSIKEKIEIETNREADNYDSNDDFNISQIKIILALKKYLEFKKNSLKENVFINQVNKQAISIDHLIEKLNRGYCGGIGALWSDAMMLAQEENHIKGTGKDIYWYYATVLTLIESNPDDLTEREKEDIEKFLSTIESLQHTTEYFLLVQHQLLAQKNEKIKESPLAKELCIAALWRIDQLITLLKKFKLTEHEFIRIESHNHATFVFKIQKGFIYFDPNDQLGGQISADETKLAQEIFKNNNYETEKPSPLFFDIFGNGKMSCCLEIDEIFKEIQPEERCQSDGYADNCNGLMIAAKSGSLPSLTYYLNKESHSDCKYNDTTKYRALCYATACGHLEIVKKLLEHGAPCNQPNDPNITPPLSFAARNGYVEILEELLAKNALLDQVDEEGKTALHFAAYWGCLEIVQKLLEKKANFSLETNSGTSPLSGAATMGHLEIVKVLLAKGANIEQADHNGATPLSNAALMGHLHIVNELLVNMADVKTADNKGFTPLFMAAQNGHLEIVKKLIAKGGRETIHKNQTDPTTGVTLVCTPLFIAAQNGHPNVVQILIDNGANIDLPFVSTAASLLEFAGSNRRSRAMEKFIKNFIKKEPNAENIKMTPLQIAKIMRHKNVVDLILKEKRERNKERLEKRKSVDPSSFVKKQDREERVNKRKSVDLSLFVKTQDRSAHSSEQGESTDHVLKKTG